MPFKSLSNDQENVMLSFQGQKNSLSYSCKPASGPYPEPPETHRFGGKNFLHVKNCNHGDSATLSIYVRQLKLHWNPSVLFEITHENGYTNQISRDRLLPC
jgi:hypothetical protein